MRRYSAERCVMHVEVGCGVALIEVDIVKHVGCRLRVGSAHAVNIRKLRIPYINTAVVHSSVDRHRDGSRRGSSCGNRRCSALWHGWSLQVLDVVVDVHLLDPLSLEVLHRRVIATSNAASAFITFALPAPFAGMEVCTSKMGGSIVVSTVDLLVAAVLAVGEKFWVRWRLNADVTFPRFRMSTLNMSFEFVSAAKPFRAQVTVRTHDFWVLRSNIWNFSDGSNISGRPVL